MIVRVGKIMREQELPSNEKSKKILLVEDDDDMRDILGFWLEGEGYEVISAPNGWEAIHTARDVRPDAMILDLLMPIVDGFQACRYVRHDPELRYLPVIMFSAVFIDAEERQMGLDVGADEFIAKTSGFNTLLASLDEVLKKADNIERPEVDEKMASLVRAEIESQAEFLSRKH